MIRKRLYTAGALVLTGIVLLGPMLHSHYLWLPEAWGGLSEIAYRIAFFITLPFRPFVMILFPPQGHHWPVAHHIVSALGTPFFYFGFWWIFSKCRRWLESRRSGTVHDAAPIGRRTFLVRSMGGVAGVSAIGFGGYVSLVAPQRVAVRQFALPIRDLPESLVGLRIVHISDTHYGPYVSLSYLEDVMAQANSLGGDLMVLTGDYVHYTRESIRDGVGVLRHLQAPLGVLAVLGNHDHWEGAAACRAAFGKTDIRLVDNDRLFLSADGLSKRGVAGNAICMAGLGDLWEDKTEFHSAIGGVDQGMPRLVLSHNPDSAELLRDSYRVDLMFSGHTHGGQIAFPGIMPIAPSRYGVKYIGGLCQGPNCRVVVSRGIGMAVLPVRFRVPPELVAVDLIRA